MNPLGGLSVAGIGAYNSEEITVGPFKWIPNENVHGHDCALMIVSTDGDPSNINNLTGGETFEGWRLVPNDDNVARAECDHSSGCRWRRWTDERIA